MPAPSTEASTASTTEKQATSAHKDVRLLRRWLIVACSVGTFLLIVPPIVYLWTGWQTRKEDLINSFSDKGFSDYFKMFDKGQTISGSNIDYKRLFRKRFAKRFGLRHYILPIMVVSITAGLASWIVVVSVLSWFDPSFSSTVVSGGGVGALLGAYLWTASDCLERLRRRNLAPIDVYNWTFRFLIAVPFGYALSAWAKDDFAVPLSFLLGAFPTQTLFTIARRIANQKLSLGESGAQAKLEIESLQCVGRSDAERFQDQDIDTIASLAWSDPVELTIRTNFQLTYVMDCASQALLWVYFGSSTCKLYPYSLRGSQEVKGLYEQIKGVTFPVASKIGLSADLCSSIATVEEIAKVLGLSECALCTTLYQVAEDPYAIFLSELWT